MLKTSLLFLSLVSTTYPLTCHTCISHVINGKLIHDNSGATGLVDCAEPADKTARQCPFDRCAVFQLTYPGEQITTWKGCATAQADCEMFLAAARNLVGVGCKEVLKCQEDLCNSASYAPISAYFIPAMDNLYGIICFIIVVIGVPGNVFAFYHFLNQQRDVASIVYIGITLVDILLCLTAIPVGISYLNNREPVLLANTLFCNVWQISFHALLVLSLLYGTVLAITRSYSILRPFSFISKRLVTGLMVTFLLLTILPKTAVYLDKGSRYTFSTATVTYNNYLYATTPIYSQTNNILTLVTSCILPLPLLTSCAMSIYTLLKTSGITAPGVGNDKRYAAVTIAMFTLLFVIFKTPTVIIDIALAVDEDIGSPFASSLYLWNLLGYLSIPLNSLCNPILYFTRMKRMRAGLKRFVMQTFNFLGGSKKAPVAQRPVRAPIQVEKEKDKGIGDSRI